MIQTIFNVIYTYILLYADIYSNIMILSHVKQGVSGLFFLESQLKTHNHRMCVVAFCWAFFVGHIIITGLEIKRMKLQQICT